MVSRRAYFARRVVNAFLTLVLVASVNFILFRILPGDPARLLLPRESVSAEHIAALRHVFRLDEPLSSQFMHYWVDIARLRFGLSFTDGRSVVSVVGERIVPTLILVGSGTVVAALVGFSTGVFAGWRRNKRLDNWTSSAAVVLYSLPIFWLGILMILVFAVTLGWFPSGGMGDTRGMYSSWTAMAVDRVYHAVLPVTTYALAFIGQYHIIVRSSIIGVMNDDFVLTARAKGLLDSQVLRRHVVPNALLPTITILMINAGLVVSGAVLTETVFNWPGMGLLVYQSIMERNYPVMQAIFLFTSVVVVLANLGADILYYYLDPRVKA